MQMKLCDLFLFDSFRNRNEKIQDEIQKAANEKVDFEIPGGTDENFIPICIGASVPSRCKLKFVILLMSLKFFFVH